MINKQTSQPPGLSHIESEIKSHIIDILNKIGIHYRIFTRVKTSTSLHDKISSKNKYSEDGDRVQDLIGVRIVTYFIDDVKILWSAFCKNQVVKSISYDEADKNIFGVLRKNMVCKLSQSHITILDGIRLTNSDYNLVDNTFEIQFRTTFSEGWLEVDHALRYKCKEDWAGFEDEERMLNGIYAATETHDRAMKALFDDIAYRHYKNGNFEAMMRMKYRLNFEKRPLSTSIISQKIAKEIIRYNREKLLTRMIDSGFHMPITYNNITHLITALKFGLDAVQDPLLKDEIERCNLYK